MVTIKQTMLEELTSLADDKGRIKLTHDEMRTLFGLNGHDLYKNLDQLRKEGHIELTEKDSRIEAVRLRLPEKKSTVKRIMSYLRAEPGATLGAWIEITTQQLSERMNLPPTRVQPAVSALLAQGQLEAQRGTKRKIIALRIPAKQRETVKVGVIAGRPEQVHQVETTAILSMPATPELDAYVAARRIARLAPNENKYLHLEFEEDPIAEEGLKLKDLLWEAITGKTRKER